MILFKKKYIIINIKIEAQMAMIRNNLWNKNKEKILIILSILWRKQETEKIINDKISPNLPEEGQIKYWHFKWFINQDEFANKKQIKGISRWNVTKLIRTIWIK